MRQFYTVLDDIRNSIIANGITNSVTTGNITEVDLDKTTIFPLSHIIVRNVSFEEHTLEVDLRIMFLDIIDVEKSLTDDDIFYGNDNSQDVLNTQLQAANMLQSQIRRGSLKDSFDILGTPTCTILRQNFENNLAGWGLEINLSMFNVELDIC